MITAGPWQEHRPSSGQRRRTTQRANPANVETALREAQKLRRVRAFGGRHRYTVSPLSFGSSGKERQPVSLRRDGQAFAIVPNWTVEPQLQLVHQRGSLTTPASLAVVQQHSHSGWLVRAGVRIKGEMTTSAGPLQPYARLNLYRSSSGTDVTRFIGPAAYTDIATRTGGTSTELAAGATLQLTQSMSLYGEVGKFWASGGDARMKSGVNASVGLKIRW